MNSQCRNAFPINKRRQFQNLFSLVSFIQTFLFLIPVGWSQPAQTDSITLSAKLLSEYVKIESVSGNEKEAGIHFSRISREIGLHVRIFTDEADSYNFAASLYPLTDGKPNIILLNHIDVVPSGADSLWTFPPFSGTISDGYVWGRGAIDNKAMGIMQLLALASFVDDASSMDLPYNVTMLVVSAEEVGGAKGAALVVDSFLDELNPVVVYGEGGVGLKGVVQARPETPFFGIEIAQKTAFWFAIRQTDPVSGHGSVPRKVYPAKDIVKVSSSLLSARQPIILIPEVRQMLREIGSHEKGLRRLALRNIGFFRHLIGGSLRQDPITNALLTNTITLTDLGSSEGAYNQMAYGAWAAFDCRLLPGTSPSEFLENNKKHFGELFDRIEIIGQAPRAGTSATGAYYDALEMAVLEVYESAVSGPILFPAHNDNSFFRAKGIPAYGLLPVILTKELVESIHNVDERIEIESLDQGIASYEALLRILLFE